MKYYFRLFSCVCCLAASVSPLCGARSTTVKAMARRAAQQYALAAERAQAAPPPAKAPAVRTSLTPEEEAVERAHTIAELRKGGEARRAAWADCDQSGTTGNGSNSLDVARIYTMGPYGIPANRPRADYFFRRAENRKELGAYGLHAIALFCENTPYSNARALACVRKGVEACLIGAAEIGALYFRNVPPRTPYERALQAYYEGLASENSDGKTLFEAYEKVLSYEDPCAALLKRRSQPECASLGITASPALTPKAFKALKAAAEKGDPAAIYAVVVAYTQGWGCEADSRAAKQWMERGAEAGEFNCLCRIGLGSLWGEASIPKDLNKAKRYLEAAARMGAPHAMTGLGFLYHNGGDGVPKDPALSLQWFTRAAQSGDPDAAEALALLFMGKRSDAEAFYWMEIAADMGESRIAGFLGRTYLSGKTVPRDEARGAYWVLRSLDDGNGNPENAASLYLFGNGVPKDDVAAGQYLFDASRAKNAWAQYFLGVRYAKGIGTARNAGKAVYWLRLAAQKGDEDAAALLASDALKNVEPVPDKYFEPSLDYLDELAEKKSPSALPATKAELPKVWTRAYAPKRPAIYGRECDTPALADAPAAPAEAPSPKPKPAAVATSAPSAAYASAPATPEAGLAAYFAASNDPDFLDALSRAYRTGDGVAKDETLADEYARRAAKVRAEKARAAQEPAR